MEQQNITDYEKFVRRFDFQAKYVLQTENLDENENYFPFVWGKEMYLHNQEADFAQWIRYWSGEEDGHERPSCEFGDIFQLNAQFVVSAPGRAPDGVSNRLEDLFSYFGEYRNPDRDGADSFMRRNIFLFRNVQHRVLPQPADTILEEALPITQFLLRDPKSLVVLDIRRLFEEEIQDQDRPVNRSLLPGDFFVFFLGLLIFESKHKHEAEWQTERRKNTLQNAFRFLLMWMIYADIIFPEHFNPAMNYNFTRLFVFLFRIEKYDLLKEFMLFFSPLQERFREMLASPPTTPTGTFADIEIGPTFAWTAKKWRTFILDMKMCDDESIFLSMGLGCIFRLACHFQAATFEHTPDLYQEKISRIWTEIKCLLPPLFLCGNASLSFREPGGGRRPCMVADYIKHQLQECRVEHRIHPVWSVSHSLLTLRSFFQGLDSSSFADFMVWNEGGPDEVDEEIQMAREYQTRLLDTFSVIIVELNRFQWPTETIQVQNDCDEWLPLVINPLSIMRPFFASLMKHIIRRSLIRFAPARLHREEVIRDLGPETAVALMRDPWFQEHVHKHIRDQADREYEEQETWGLMSSLVTCENERGARTFLYLMLCAFFHHNAVKDVFQMVQRMENDTVFLGPTLDDFKVTLTQSFILPRTKQTQSLPEEECTYLLVTMIKKLTLAHRQQLVGRDKENLLWLQVLFDALKGWTQNPRFFVPSLCHILYDTRPFSTEEEKDAWFKALYYFLAHEFAEVFSVLNGLLFLEGLVSQQSQLRENLERVLVTREHLEVVLWISLTSCRFNLFFFLWSHWNVHLEDFTQRYPQMCESLKTYMQTSIQFAEWYTAHPFPDQSFIDRLFFWGNSRQSLLLNDFSFQTELLEISTFQCLKQQQYQWVNVQYVLGEGWKRWDDYLRKLARDTGEDLETVRKANAFRCASKCNIVSLMPFRLGDLYLLCENGHGNSIDIVTTKILSSESLPFNLRLRQHLIPEDTIKCSICRCVLNRGYWFLFDPRYFEKGEESPWQVEDTDGMGDTRDVGYYRVVPITDDKGEKGYIPYLVLQKGHPELPPLEGWIPTMSEQRYREIMKKEREENSNPKKRRNDDPEGPEGDTDSPPPKRKF